LHYYLWGRIKSLVYAVKSSTRPELLNRIMDAENKRNDKPSLARSAASLSRRATMIIDNQGSHVDQLLN
jgi:hypothetical protein